MKIKNKKYHVNICRYIIRSYVVVSEDEHSAAHKSSLLLDKEEKDYIEGYDITEVGEDYEKTEF